MSEAEGQLSSIHELTRRPLSPSKPHLIVYGGTIMPGKHTMDVPGINRKAGDRAQISDNYEALGSFWSGKITDEQRMDIVKNSCPGPGSCGGMYTANTLSTCIEAMGMSLPFSSSAPAVSQEKVQECLRAPAAMRKVHFPKSNPPSAVF